MSSLGLAHRHEWLLIPKVIYNIFQRLRQAMMSLSSLSCQNGHSGLLENLWALISGKGTGTDLEASVCLYVFWGNPL